MRNKEIIDILELIVQTSKDKDLIRFTDLNQEFDKYDLIRQSCLCSFKFPDSYEESINDAINRLKELKYGRKD